MATVTLLDKVLGYIDPNAGLRRMRARELLARAYEAASPKDGWRPRRAGASANADHLADAGAVRVKARSLVQNVPYVTSGVDSLVANVVGTGIMPRSLSGSAKDIDNLWDAWGADADADGERDIYGLQAAAMRAMEVDGEVLVRLRPRRPDDGLPVPLQLQLLEIDWLDTTKNGLHEGNTIIGGIEYNALGRKVFYWLFDQHPGDMQTFRITRTSRPVPADRIIHLYNPQRPGQGRGFSRLAPVISRVRDLQLYEDAELQRKNLETRLGVIASGDATLLANGQDAPDLSEIKKTGSLGSLPSGGIINTPAGVNLTLVEPKALPGYVDYVKHQLHLIAAGMGVTYEMLTGDVTEVNFSSARVALLEFRRNAEQFQWLTLIPKLCLPIWRAFIDAAYLAGKLQRVDYAVDWSTPKWDYVNPVQDVSADLDEISGGLSSFSEKLRRRGYKPELVFQELKSDMERLKKDGTLDLILMLQKGRTMDMARSESSSAGNSSSR